MTIFVRYLCRIQNNSPSDDDTAKHIPTDNQIKKHIKNLIMNKTDLVNEIAAKASLNKVDAKKALDAMLESIGQALAKDDKVLLIGFGSFAMVEKPERTGLNPRTKEKIVIPARKVVKFKAADSLGK